MSIFDRVAPEYIEGVRKVKWDECWHVLFNDRGGKENYDRVSREEAMRVLKKLTALRKQNKA